MDSGYILKVKLLGLAGVLDVEYEREGVGRENMNENENNHDSKGFALGSWKRRLDIT